MLRRLLGPAGATAVTVAVCAAGRMLDTEATAVARLLCDGDLAAARDRVRSLVGRSTDDLDTPEITRAVVESVAENCADAVVGTLWWATIAGAPGAALHRGLNILDAMVGHRDPRYERFGWAAARLDDAVNFVPARLCAAAVVLARPRRARAVWAALRRDAPAHPSPNAGVAEAAFAAALGVRLGGVNRYGGTVEDRGTLGDGPPPSLGTIPQSVRLRRHATVATLAVLACGRMMYRFGLRCARRRVSPGRV
jgi:adenosylcobinamide-phosphate synthase